MGCQESFSVANEVAGVISSFVKKFCLGTLLNRCNITKTRGASPLIIFEIVFSLAFSGKNLFQGVVRNKNVSIGKDAVYSMIQFIVLDLQKAPNNGYLSICYAVVIRGCQSSKDLKNGIVKNAR